MILMIKTLLNKTVASAIQGEDVTSMNRFGDNCKTAKDWKKLEQRCYRKGWMYKLFIDGHLWVGKDNFALFADYSERGAIDFAFGFAKFSASCFACSSDVPDYIFPFQLYHQDRLVYQYVPQTQRPDWEVYELHLPIDPYERYRYFYYSKNKQTAIEEAHHKMRLRMLKDEGRWATPDDYSPRFYQVLRNGEVFYEYTPSPDIYVNPEYLVTDPRFR